MVDVSLPISRRALVALSLALLTVTGLLAMPGLGPVLADEDDESDRHQHPDDYADDRGLSGTIDWLSNELSNRLGDSAASISEGQYELGRSVLGDEYDDRLGQFFEVTGDTDGDEDERSAGDAYEDAATDQERLSDLLEEYDETYEAYETARDDGEDELARELARELEALAEEINDLADELIITFEFLENETDTDFSDPTEAINETNDRVSEDQQRVRDEQFVATDLVLVDPVDPASIAEPVTVTGQLEAADGSTIEPDDGSLVVGGQSVAYDLDADGTITFEYHPAAMADLGTEEIPVRYRPATQSAYLGSQATMNISIEQTLATLELDEHTETVGYGDTLTVAGEIYADGPVTGSVPIALSIDGGSIGEVNATDGTFDGNVSVPTSLSPGTHTLTAEIAHDDRALGPATAETDVTVSETETVLSIGADHDENASTLALDGSLETQAGEPVPNQSVTVTIDDETVTVVTGDDGTFAGTIAVPEGATGEQVVEATFDGTGTNLATATTETTVELPAEGGSLLTPIAIAGLIGLVALAAGAAFVWYRRRSSGGSDGGEPTPGEPTATFDAGTDGPTVPDESVSLETLLSLARTRYEDGDPAGAVRIGYTAVRRAYDGSLEDTSALTHWEFYRRAREHGDDEHLRAVTEGYERATFAPGSIPESDAASTLTSVTALCGSGSAAGAVAPADD